MSHEKELRIVNNATPGPWVWERPSEDDWPQSDQSLVTTWKGEDGQPETVVHAWGYDASGIEASPQDRLFIAWFNLERVRELLEENRELQARLKAVEKLHTPTDGHNPECHCGIPPNDGRDCRVCEVDGWPCPTIKAVQGV